MSITSRRASASSAQTITSESMDLSGTSRSSALTFWNAAATVESGKMAWAWSAAEPSSTRTALARPLLNSSGATRLTTVFPASSSVRAARVSRWAAYGTDTSTTSALDATSAFAAPPTDPAGACSSTLSAALLARDSSRDPMSTCSPARANLSASPLPSGPVPPTIPNMLATST